MDPEYRNKPRDVRSGHGAEEMTQLGAQAGEALYVKACAACHTIGRGDRIGPDLAGVTDRRDRDWLTRFIIAPSRMFDEKDPEALALLKRYRGVRMPAIGLSDTDVADLLSYIEHRSAGVERPRADAGQNTKR